MAPNFTNAIFALYSNVVSISGETLDTCVALDNDNNVVVIDNAAVEAELVVLQDQYAVQTCKDTAVTILNNTDWTSIGDVGNPSMSNPYLANQAAFIAYRNQIRNYAINPVADPVWPTEPTVQWASAPTK